MIQALGAQTGAVPKRQGVRGTSPGGVVLPPGFAPVLKSITTETEIVKILLPLAGGSEFFEWGTDDPKERAEDEEKNESIYPLSTVTNVLSHGAEIMGHAVPPVGELPGTDWRLEVLIGYTGIMTEPKKRTVTVGFKPWFEGIEDEHAGPFDIGPPTINHFLAPGMGGRVTVALVPPKGENLPHVTWVSFDLEVTSQTIHKGPVAGTITAGGRQTGIVAS